MAEQAQRQDLPRPSASDAAEAVPLGGHADGHADGHPDGRRDGHAKGHRDGHSDGHADGPSAGPGARRRFAGQARASDELGEPRSRGAAVLAYGANLLIPVGFFLAPLVTLILWRAHRDEDWLSFHARQALDIVLVALAAGIAWLAGRGLGGMPGALLQWGALALAAAAWLLLLWGAVEAGRGGSRWLPVPSVLRRARRPHR